MASWRCNVNIFKYLLTYKHDRYQQNPSTKDNFIICNWFFYVCVHGLFSKYFGGVMPITQAVWGRFFFHFIALGIYFLIFKPKDKFKKKF